MNRESVKITDRKLIEEVFHKRFRTTRVFIKSSDINIQTSLFSYNNGVIITKAPEVDEKARNVIFYIRDNDEVIFCHAAFRSASPDGEFVYDPLDIQIISLPRKEERKGVAPVGKSESASVYVSKIISDFTIHECLNLSREKVNLVKDEILKKLFNDYLNSEIIFLNDKPNDPRMFYFKKRRMPYFIKNISDIEDSVKIKSSQDLKYYKEFIYNKESLESRTKIVSEIAVPLLYKMMMPFGYIRISSRSEFSEEDFSVIRKFGMSASTVYTNDKTLIVSSDDRIAVTDLSLRGLGIFFKEKVLIKHFKENSLLIFSIFLPDKKQATMLCEVKNISLIKNYIYRIGCEILNIEALGEVYYSEYLEWLESG